MTLERPKFEFRITKYDPTKRDAKGVYLGDEWYCFKYVEDGDVPIAECVEIENRYIAAATKMLRNDGCENVVAYAFDETEQFPLTDLAERLRLCLREKSNKQFRAGNAFVHIGYDYYMYVGVSSYREETLKEIEESGLFVEPFYSPYFPEDEAP